MKRARADWRTSVIAAAIVAAASTCLYVFAPLDGDDGLLFHLIGRVDTEYAPGYSDWEFRLIRPGMTMDAVRRHLGAPLDAYDIPKETDRCGNTRIGWRYSRTPSDASDSVRVLLFDCGRVSEVIHEFYVD